MYDTHFKIETFINGSKKLLSETYNEPIFMFKLFNWLDLRMEINF